MTCQSSYMAKSISRPMGICTSDSGFSFITQKPYNMLPSACSTTDQYRSKVKDFLWEVNFMHLRPLRPKDFTYYVHFYKMYYKSQVFPEWVCAVSALLPHGSIYPMDHLFYQSINVLFYSSLIYGENSGWIFTTVWWLCTQLN